MNFESLSQCFASTFEEDLGENEKEILINLTAGRIGVGMRRS